MTWIATIAYDDAEGPLRRLCDRVKGPGDHVDNIMQAHSLRPHSMEGHMALYKSVLHHARNLLDRWLLEALGVYVSLLNGCGYCVEHHFTGMCRLLGDNARGTAIRSALEAGAPERVFEGPELALMRYASRLTRAPATVTADDIALLRAVGLDDGRILEANQVIAYFGYANRTVLGLGVTTDGDILGLAPDNLDDRDDWSHR